MLRLKRDKKLLAKIQQMGLEGKGYKKLLQFCKTATYAYFVYLTIFPAKTVDFQVFIW